MGEDGHHELPPQITTTFKFQITFQNDSAPRSLRCTTRGGRVLFVLALSAPAGLRTLTYNAISSNFRHPTPAPAPSRWASAVMTYRYQSHKEKVHPSHCNSDI